MLEVTRWMENSNFVVVKWRGDMLYSTVQVYTVVHYRVVLTLKLSLIEKLPIIIFLGSFINYQVDQEQVFHITLLQWIYPTLTLSEGD